MNKRRQAAELEAAAGLLEQEARDISEAVGAVIGKVPQWVPAPAMERACRIAASLIAGGHEPAALRGYVDAVLTGGQLFDGAAPSLQLVRDIHELASFVYGSRLAKAAGLLHLAGEQAELGQRFKEGRRSGATSPIRKAVEALLRKHPCASTDELWQSIEAKPPKGWSACDNRQGKYLEGPGNRNIQYRAFENMCSKVRKVLKEQKSSSSER